MVGMKELQNYLKGIFSFLCSQILNFKLFLSLIIQMLCKTMKNQKSLNPRLKIENIWKTPTIKLSF